MTFQPYTYIKCIRGNMWTEKYKIGDIFIFLGYITNPEVSGDNVLLVNRHGAIVSADIKDEDWEAMRTKDATN